MTIEKYNDRTEPTVDLSDHFADEEHEPLVSEDAQPIRQVENVVPAPVPATPQRLASLDAFRGLTILGMLLVNNIALNTHTPAQLMHARWNGGVHFADLVMPFFLLIVGISLPYSWASHRRKNWGRGRFVGKAFSRAVILLVLGCLLDSSIARMPVIDLDVLQMIGLSYFVAAVITMLLPPIPRLGAALILLAAHSMFLLHTSVPGMRTGTFLEHTNVVNYVNAHILARYHLAGLISVVPGSALVLIGTFVGELLRRERFLPAKRLKQVVAWAIVFIAAGVLWNTILPYNKPVWTASYILLCAGLGSLVLVVLYWMLDVSPLLRPYRGWAIPLQVFGANAIVAYALPILTKMLVLRVWVWPGTHVVLQTAFLHESQRRWGLIDGGWTYTLCYIGFWWLILLYLYRRKLYVRV